MSNSYVQIIKSGGGIAGVTNLFQKLRKLKESEVLIGIPADKAQRKGDEINNASLAFIHTHGSPLNHIPPRPFLEPGVMRAKDIIAKKLALASKAILEGKPDQATKFLNQAGQAGANSAKRYILEGGNLAPNAPSTIRQKGSSKPLIDKSQLVKSITYVVRESGVETLEDKTKVTEKFYQDAKTTTSEIETEATGAAEVGEVIL